MPYLLLRTGCVFLGLGIVGLWVPTLHTTDIQLVEYLSENRNIILDQIAQLLALVGGMPFFVLASIWFSIQQYRKSDPKNVVFILFCVAGSIIISWLLKWQVARPRPLQLYHLVDSYGASFPSAHSIYAASFGSLAILIFRQDANHRYITVLACLWMIIMGCSRVYAGVHFPTDVLAGWGIGMIWVSLLWLYLYKANI